ncbi:MAG: hypothetical protein ACLUKQ_10495, partial [Peptococcaceae bacterium]
KTNCVADRRNSEFWQRIGQPYAHNQGDVLLPLSTLKRIDEQMSGARRLFGRVGGQATNNLPMMQHRTKNCST